MNSVKSNGNNFESVTNNNKITLLLYGDSRFDENKNILILQLSIIVFLFFFFLLAYFVSPAVHTIAIGALLNLFLVVLIFMNTL